MSAIRSLPTPGSLLGSHVLESVPKPWQRVHYRYNAANASFVRHSVLLAWFGDQNDWETLQMSSEQEVWLCTDVARDTSVMTN